MPRDQRDTGEHDGGGRDGAGHDGSGGRPVRDRPGGPAAEGGQTAGAGEVTPAASDEEGTPQDDVVEERRQHVVEAHGPDGTESGS